MVVIFRPVSLFFLCKYSMYINKYEWWMDSVCMCDFFNLTLLFPLSNSFAHSSLFISYQCIKNIFGFMLYINGLCVCMYVCLFRIFSCHTHFFAVCTWIALRENDIQNDVNIDWYLRCFRFLLFYCALQQVSNDLNESWITADCIDLITSVEYWSMESNK